MALAVKNSKAVFSIGLLCVCAGCGEEPLKCQRENSPEVTIRESVVFLGVVRKKVVEANLVLSNQSEDLHQVTEVETSCGCSVVTSLPEIAPKNEVRLTIRISVNSPGYGRSTVRVYTTASPNPLKATIEWFGDHPPEIVPNRLVFQRNRPFEQRAYIVVAGGNPNRPLSVDSIHSSDSDFRIELGTPSVRRSAVDVLASENHLVLSEELPLHVIWTPSKPASERISHKIDFVFTHFEKKYRRSLYVDVVPNEALSCIPRTLVFSGVESTSPIRRVIVSCKDTLIPFVFLKPSHFECSLRKLEERVDDTVEYELIVHADVSSAFSVPEGVSRKQEIILGARHMSSGNLIEEQVVIAVLLSGRVP